MLSVLIEILLFTAAFIPLYLLGYSVTGKKAISFILSAVPFFAFVGNSLHFYFMSLLFPFLSLALLFAHKKRYLLATIFFICTISFREYMALAWLIMGIILTFPCLVDYSLRD
jgi:uncharacterized membrane protein